MRKPLMCLAVMASISRVACGTAQVAATPPRGPVAETDRFSFYTDPDINLHHLLYHWARAENGEALTVVVERGQVDVLTDEERVVWEQAVRAYWRNAGTRHILFDDDLVALRDRIAGRGGPEGLPDRDVRLYRALESARPVYAAHWAEAHRGRNERWIRDLLEDLPAVEGSIGDGIAAAFGGRWPEIGIRPSGALWRLSPKGDRIRTTLCRTSP